MSQRWSLRCQWSPHLSPEAAPSVDTKKHLGSGRWTGRKPWAPYSLHCSSFLGLPFIRILNIKLVKPKKGTTMETIGLIERKLQLGSLGYIGRLYGFYKVYGRL